MSFLTGKAAKSTSQNTNNALLKSIYSPVMQQGVAAGNTLAGGLGVPGGDSAGATAGFKDYLKNAGFSNVLQQLQQGIVGGNAASGLLRSGATDTALLNKGTALDHEYYQNYLQNLLGLSGQGMNAGGIVANAGQQSTQTGSTPGLLGTLGSLAGGAASIMSMPISGPATAGTLGAKIFSDRRLKADIEKIGEYEDGLGVYRFRYIGQVRKLIGVMADEVAKLRPWALGPKFAGYATVNYGAL